MMKVALVHDWLLGLGGAERVLKVLHEMFPEAPIYTLFYNPSFVREFLPQAKIRPSFAQKWYSFIPKHKLLLPFLPIAIESWDFSEFDMVVSSSIAFSKGLILKPKTKHLCYCYSPTRFLWDWSQEYTSGRWGIKIMQHFLRIWDYQTNSRVDQFAAISKNIQQRIKKYYGRESVIIYPPLSNFQSRHSGRDPDTKSPGFSIFTNSMPPNSDYYLIVSRLFPHKNIDIAIEAFNKLKQPLLIVGEGPEYRKLKKKIACSDLIKMIGAVKDEELALYYLHAKAFIMPQEEDFGLTPLEAMSFGKPVLALRRGGALEYILEGINGEFFDEPHPAVLADGVRRLNENFHRYSHMVIKKIAERFSRQRFEEEMKKLISQL